MKLYEISAEYKTALDHLQSLVDSGDIDEQTMIDTLDGLDGDMREKCINTAAVFKNYEADIKAMKEAEANIAQRRKSLESQINWLKNYLKTNMERTEITEISSPYFAIKIKKCPPSVVVDGEVPDDFMKIVKNPDKAAIKQAIKDGEDIDFAHLEQGTRLEIK